MHPLTYVIDLPFTKLYLKNNLYVKLLFFPLHNINLDLEVKCSLRRGHTDTIITTSLYFLWLQLFWRPAIWNNIAWLIRSNFRRSTKTPHSAFREERGMRGICSCSWRTCTSTSGSACTAGSVLSSWGRSVWACVRDCVFVICVTCVFKRFATLHNAF